ncbi:MAG: OsmC family protein, partial [Mucilaginibacter sp.]
ITLNLFFRLEGEKKITVMDRGLDFISPVTDEQRQRLIQIGKACPISKMLEGEIRIRTFDTPLQSEVVILEP